MARYLYVFRGGMRQEGKELSPQELQQGMARWMAWVGELRQSGHFKGGDPLEPKGGKFISGKNRAVTDGPFAEAKDLVGGYFMMECKNLDEAVELARGCPDFERGGTVEIRAVREM